MKILVYYIIGVNVLAYFIYGIDKGKAKFHKWRIPEMILLNLSLIGGVFGSIMGMNLFHHKTKKILFKIVNTICFIIYVIIIYYIVINYGGNV